VCFLAAREKWIKKEHYLISSFQVFSHSKGSRKKMPNRVPLEGNKIIFDAPIIICLFIPSAFFYL
jgi:hypothetical protein